MWMVTCGRFIYGGWNAYPGQHNDQYDKIFALSLQAFRWFRVWNISAHARIGHTCHVVSRRQLLSIGGADVVPVEPVNGS
jgi:hypothetical protein